MDMLRQIDVTFDFRSDTPPGMDPDARSPTLRRYHRLLWSKPLPSGRAFELDDALPASICITGLNWASSFYPAMR